MAQESRACSACAGSTDFFESSCDELSEYIGSNDFRQADGEGDPTVRRRSMQKPPGQRAAVKSGHYCPQPGRGRKMNRKAWLGLPLAFVLGCHHNLMPDHDSDCKSCGL